MVDVGLEPLVVVERVGLVLAQLGLLLLHDLDVRLERLALVAERVSLVEQSGLRAVGFGLALGSFEVEVGDGLGELVGFFILGEEALVHLEEGGLRRSGEFVESVDFFLESVSVQERRTRRGLARWAA